MGEIADDREQTEERGGRSGAFDKAKGVLGSAKQQVSRSAEVLSGADIRKFDDFTDATTRAVVGVHRDQAELREGLGRTDQAVNDVREIQANLAEQLVRTNQTIDDVRQGQAKLAERLEHLERSVDRVLQGQEALSARVGESTHAHAAPEESSKAVLAPWVVTVAVSGVALLLSIAAIVTSMF